MKYGKSRNPLFHVWRNQPPVENPVTFDERVRAIWPYLIRRVLTFTDTLRPRERANYDHEDLLIELYLKLNAKDKSWDEARGRYITFAATIIDHELASLRDRSRTVESPRNTTGRLKEYEAELAAGSLTAKRAKTFTDVRRACGEIEPVEGKDGLDEADPNYIAETDESQVVSHAAVVQAIRPLSHYEARVVGETYGLWGQPTRSFDEVSKRTGTSVHAVQRAHLRACSKMRSMLLEMGHPAVASDN